MKSNKLIIVLLLLIASLMFHNSRSVIGIDKKEYNGAKELGFTSNRLYYCVLDALDKDQSESVTEEELTSVTSLYCPKAGISDTTGIEKLVNLENLALYDNNITSIDLSHNTNLKVVYLGDNKLSNIKLPASSTLGYLSLDNNSLTSINLKSLPNLLYLTIINNRLNQLDVSSNTHLGLLYVPGNNIESIDLSKNTELVYLDLFNNLLTSIDLSKATELNYLNVSKNKITSLDLSNNTNLEEVSAALNKFDTYNIPNKENINRLVIDYNKIKNFNFSEYPNLDRLTIMYRETINVSSPTINAEQLEGKLPEGLHYEMAIPYSTFKDVSGCDSFSIGEVKHNNQLVDGTIIRNSVLTQEALPLPPMIVDNNNCDEITIYDEVIDSSKYDEIQIRAGGITIDGVAVPSSVDVEFTGYYDVNYLSSNDSNNNDNNTNNNDNEVDQVINDVPNTGVTIINIILFGITVLITGIYIVLKAMQTNKIRND